MAAPSGTDSKVKGHVRFQSKPTGSEKFRYFRSEQRARFGPIRIDIPICPVCFYSSSAVLLLLIENVASAGKRNHIRDHFLEEFNDDISGGQKEKSAPSGLL